MEEKPADRMKREAGYYAADMVGDGMVVGLGTGSTIAYTMERLSDRIQKRLRIQGVPTSFQTEMKARDLHIPLTTLDDYPEIEMAIDGADQVDDHLRLIKGRGAALTRKKSVVASLGQELFAVERSWRNLTGKEQEAVLVCEMERLGEVEFCMIPGITSNGNRRWPKARFQGLKSALMSAQDAAESISGAQWVIAGDRSTVPACTITESGATVVGMYADPKDAGFSSCSLEETSSGLIQRIWWPHQ